MKRTTWVAVTMLLAATAPASATSIIKKGYIQGGVPTLPCAVQVDFGSAATGPDMAAWSAIRSYVADLTDLEEAEAWGWGREGEFSLCLRVSDAKIAKTVFDDLTRLTSAEPSANGGWTKVTAGTGPSKKE